ncbi:hypothetical protein R6Q59_013102 [Mikania micrantha]
MKASRPSSPPHLSLTFLRAKRSSSLGFLVHSREFVQLSMFQVTRKNIDKFKAKGVDSVICVSVNDPYTMNGWAEKLDAKEAIEFYGDFDGKFHKSLDLNLDLSAALLGHRSTRWSAFVEDGKVKVLNVENVPSDFKVSGGEVILGQI